MPEPYSDSHILVGFDNNEYWVVDKCTDGIILEVRDVFTIYYSIFSDEHHAILTHVLQTCQGRIQQRHQSLGGPTSDCAGTTWG